MVIVPFVMLPSLAIHPRRYAFASESTDEKNASSNARCRAFGFFRPEFFSKREQGKHMNLPAFRERFFCSALTETL